MATVKVNDLLNKAQTILQDTTGTRWPEHELVGWLNDAYREIILARPDANSESGDFTCAEGTRQVLTKDFPNALRLMDVVRNKAGNERAVRLIERQILDDQRRGWHTEPASVDIEHYIFDPKLPREFLVYPPATSAAQLEVVYSSVPTDHPIQEDGAAEEVYIDYGSSSSITVGGESFIPASETIKIVDSYANAILDYMLYRAYSKDAKYAANGQRAVRHYQAMQAAIGIKTQSDTATMPRDLETLVRVAQQQQQEQ